MKKLTKNKILGILFTIISIATFCSYSSAPPSSFTGAQGSYCNDCHGGAALNTAGGSIVATGLPTAYAPNGVYNFSLKIMHGAANRQKWGFAITAVDMDGNALGSFTTTNPNSDVVGDELQHLSAPSTPASSNYTFNNLTWTAPATPSGQVMFYMVGLAANGNGSSSGDFAYSAIVNSAVLPVKLINFNGSSTRDGVHLVWQTSTEINNHHFDIERSFDGQNFDKIGEVAAKQTVFSLNQYGFQDRSLSSKTAYYRLIQVDNDGKKNNSAAIQIKGKTQQTATVFPNPSQNELNVTLPNNENIDAIEIFNSNGSLVILENNLSFSIQDLAIGVYFVKIKTKEGSTYVEKISKL